MKKLSILFFALISFNLNAQKIYLEDIVEIAAILGILGMTSGLVAQEANYIIKQKNLNYDGVFVFADIDPKIALIDNNLDYRTGLGYRKKRAEAAVTYENHMAIGYQGISLSVGYVALYQRINLTFSPEITSIWRSADYVKKKHVISIGINSELRFNITDNIAVYGNMNIKTRPENSFFSRLSNYSGIKYTF